MMVVNNGSYVSGGVTVSKDWVDLVDESRHSSLQSDVLIGKRNFVIEATGISTSLITSSYRNVVCCSRVEKETSGWDRNIAALGSDGKIYSSQSFSSVDPATGTVTLPSGLMFSGSYNIYAW